ncbi:alpha/beta hydrolase [Brevundimonas bacteroides]|uniref:alpha/beta hydrolase n=1 Tax=Brevundimonas bacteroides TaxID=74311 RepID=UPI000495EA07|nr:alpha/beta hydrolase-fold protein [Brevundimonas bacteroides]
MRFTALVSAVAVLLAAVPVSAQTPEPTPIVIGQSYALPSMIMGRPREINVWLPPGHGEDGRRYPVLYVLDGGQAQDFHHISGLAQLGTVNGSTRDVIVVGVASMDRRNELALRSSNPDLIAQYPTQGDSARFRRFLAEEVVPFVETTFATDDTSVLMGESLAGLFVVETALKTPALFDAYVAISPSLWWDDGDLADQAESLLAAHPPGPRALMLSIADEGAEMQAAMDVLVAALRSSAPAGLTWTYDPRPDESHATIYHGAALDAFRALFPYPPEP